MVVLLLNIMCLFIIMIISTIITVIIVLVDFVYGQPIRVVSQNRCLYLLPTNIICLITSEKIPVDMRIAPLILKITLGSSPLKSRSLVRRLAVTSLNTSSLGHFRVPLS